MQRSAVTISANKTNKQKKKKERGRGGEENWLQAQRSTIKTLEGELEQVLLHTLLTLLSVACLFQLKGEKQAACTSVLFCKTLSQLTEKEGLRLSWNQEY